MEGFINLVWDGDRVLWKNFLKHYLYTMANSLILAIIDKTIIKDDLPILFNEFSFPTKEYENLFIEIRDNYFNNKDVTEILDLLQFYHDKKRKVTIPQIESILNCIRLHTLYYITNILRKNGYISWNIEKIPALGMFKKLKRLIPQAESEYPDIMEKIFWAFNKVSNDTILRLKIDLKENSNDLKNFFLFDFTKIYLSQIKKMICSIPCTTCFTEQCDSPSLWGYYGDNHRGICLIFDDKKDTDEIDFILNRNKISIHTKTQKVKYTKKYEEINFFKMLGNLPVGVVADFWLKDWEGNVTTCKGIINNYPNKIWTNKSHEYFYNNFSIKLPDWKKEREHRIILEKNYFCGNTNEEKKFTYDFNLLRGIIFGIKTKDEEKAEIIEIIKQKCNLNNRNDFELYQAEYDDDTGLINSTKIHL